MDSKFIKKTLESLKNPSTTRVLESIGTIKHKIISNGEGLRLFRECNGLEHLVYLLRKSNYNKVIDATLSTLGNCCMDDECCVAVGKLNIISTLITFLTKTSRDSILGRSCRLIGNLSQKVNNAETFHNNNVIPALITVIECKNKNITNPTLSMAVRALRILWVTVNKKDEMLSMGVVRVVSTLLCVQCELTGLIKCDNELSDIRTSQEELFNNILKCMGYFSTMNVPACAEQMQGDGRGYQCLVALSRFYERASLKCLMNLCYVSSCRPLLGVAGFVERLVDILQKCAEVSEWPEGASKALASFSCEAVNRSRLRRSGGLTLLLKAARYTHHSLRALLHFVFDNAAVQILIDEGLINFLSEELADCMTTMPCEHDNSEKQSKPSPITTNCEENKNLVTSEVKTLKSKLLSNADNVNVVIEMDNMLVGFMDAKENDFSDSDTDCSVGKGLKRARSHSPNDRKISSQDPQLVKMASMNWSSSVYWEPKSPELPSSSRSSAESRSMFSPERATQSWSPDGDSSRFKRPRWDWSPESGIDTLGSRSTSSPYWAEYQWSPDSMSSLKGNEDSSDSEGSGRYSPICSDVEDDMDREDHSIDTLDTHTVVRELDDLVMEDEEENFQDIDVDDEDTDKSENERLRARVSCLLVLMLRVVSNMDTSNNIPDLIIRSDCLSTLLLYIQRCRRPLGCAANILARILSNAICLMGVLRNRMPVNLYKITTNARHPLHNCKQCKQISGLCTRLMSQISHLAESAYGIGEICYQLLKGSQNMKQTLAITLPHIVRSEKIMRKYFLVCDGLNVLFTIIENSLENVDDFVLAVSKLAINLEIKDPKTLEQRFKGHIHVKYDPILDGLGSDDIVTFQLDDLSSVQANKVFLCQNSEVFNAMLMGKFKESKEKHVRLKNITKSALEYMIMLLQCGFNDSGTELHTFPLAESLETNLEVLLLTDRFLFDKIKELLSSAIQQFLLSSENAAQIYKWSLSEGMGFLCVESTAYILTGNMCDLDRINSFKSILNMKYKIQWLDDIRTMIMRHFSK